MSIEHPEMVGESSVFINIHMLTVVTLSLFRCFAFSRCLGSSNVACTSWWQFTKAMGRGGYGEVIMALDLSRNRHVAIKRISGLSNNPVRAEHFGGMWSVRYWANWNPYALLVRVQGSLPYLRSTGVRSRHWHGHDDQGLLVIDILLSEWCTEQLYQESLRNTGRIA